MGAGLEGASAASTLAEQGYPVKLITYHDSPRRAHSVAAQGGINAADFATRSTEKDRYIKHFHVVSCIAKHISICTSGNYEN